MATTASRQSLRAARRAVASPTTPALSRASARLPPDFPSTRRRKKRRASRCHPRLAQPFCQGVLGGGLTSGSRHTGRAPSRSSLARVAEEGQDLADAADGGVLPGVGPVPGPSHLLRAASPGEAPSVEEALEGGLGEAAAEGQEEPAPAVELADGEPGGDVVEDDGGEEAGAGEGDEAAGKGQAGESGD